jgi:hypothetical protein
MHRHRPTAGKERQFSLLLALGIEGFDELEPALALRVVDLAQVKYLALNPPAPATDYLFHRDLTFLATLEPRMTH